MGKIVIVGSGPAGCSAALYAARAGMETTVISKGIGALQKAEQIQNYYGFEEGITGAELYRRGVAGAQAVGTQFVTAEVVGLDYAATLVVQTTAGDYPADAVILATGTGRIAPKIAGLAEHEGRGVSYCATCDAFFYRGKTAAVLGTGEYALHEVQAAAAGGKGHPVHQRRTPDGRVPRRGDRLHRKAGGHRGRGNGNGAAVGRRRAAACGRSVCGAGRSRQCGAGP